MKYFHLNVSPVICELFAGRWIIKCDLLNKPLHQTHSHKGADSIMILFPMHSPSKSKAIHMNENEKSPILHSITGMRGIACLFIVCYHYYCLYIDDMGLGLEGAPLAPYSELFFEYSKNAVELFFMLAGFLTAYHYRDKIAGMSPWDYFRKHYVKLLIPSVIVTLWALVNAEIRLNLIPGSDAIVRTPTPLRIILSILMINTGWFTSIKQTGLPVNSTMWFIDVLLLCYLFYYLIRKLSGTSYIFLGMCSIMVLVGWICLTHTPKLPFLWSLTGRGYATFFIGVLLCEFQTEAEPSLRKKVSFTWFVMIIGVLFVRLVLGFETVFGEIGNSDYIRYFEFFAAPALILAALNLDPVKRFFEWKPFLWLGILASMIYYVHNNLMEDYLIIDSLNGSRVNFSSAAVCILAVASTVLCAWAVSAVNKRIHRTQS